MINNCPPTAGQVNWIFYYLSEFLLLISLATCFTKTDLLAPSAHAPAPAPAPAHYPTSKTGEIIYLLLLIFSLTKNKRKKETTNFSVFQFLVLNLAYISRTIPKKIG